MEQALRNECGYQGPMPYWDWAQTAQTGLTKHPLFDGSAYSMSGDGAKVQQTGDIVLSQPSLPDIHLPTANGGGCVASGPFKDWKVNLGPQQLSVPGGAIVGPPSGNPLDYNPRCLKRDLTDYINRRYANASSIIDTIRRDSIYEFQGRMQGNLPLSETGGQPDIGIHGGPHYALGGDPGRDVGVSSSDPAFFLHHGMIDRAYWIWQMLDYYPRTYGDNAINGTGTFLNMPPSAPQTLDTVLSQQYVTDQSFKIRDLISTTAGPFCYIYL
jgi:tyrosinase